MKKLLRPKDLLLLGLAGFLDVFEEVRDPFGVAADTCKNLYGWVPERFKRHNFTRVMGRSLRTGEIERVVKNENVYLRLTSYGEKAIIRDFPIISLQKRKWDGKWRMVVFDIAEVSRQTRDLLRLKLKELGLGMLQKSVWVTPYDIILDFREFVEEKSLGDSVYLMEVSHLLAGDARQLVEKTWKLGKLNKDYQNLLEKIRKLKDMYIVLNDRIKQCQAKMTEEEREETVKRFKRKIEARKKNLRKQYLEFLLSDPCLPKELLPKDWAGDLVKKEIVKI